MPFSPQAHHSGRQLLGDGWSDGCGPIAPVEQALKIEISEKRPERPAHRLAGIRAPIRSVALNISDDVFLIELAEVSGARGTELPQKLTDHWQLPQHRRGHQAALVLQIITERLVALRWPRR